jgi:hypothetical protein
MVQLLDGLNIGRGKSERETGPHPDNVRSHGVRLSGALDRLP